jgi:hypothetical protein
MGFFYDINKQANKKANRQKIEEFDSLNKIV